jgi:hypothetical protein
MARPRGCRGTARASGWRAKSRAKARRNPSPRKKKPTGMERGMVRFLLVTITSSACRAPRA